MIKASAKSKNIYKAEEYFEIAKNCNFFIFIFFPEFGSSKMIYTSLM
jgi:hypothetical protein